MRLALYVGLAGFALRIEGVELEIEVMLGRFSGVDGATELLLGWLIHGHYPRDYLPD